MPYCKVPFSRLVKQTIAITCVVMVSMKTFIFTLKKDPSVQVYQRAAACFQSLEEATSRTLDLHYDDIETYFFHIEMDQLCYRNDQGTPVGIACVCPKIFL